MPDVNLEHVGILGMKWGHRKGGSSNRDSLGRSRGSEDHQTAQTIKRKRIKDMSNEELRKLTTRMSLEKQYRDLKSTNVNRGSKMVSDILTQSGKTLASGFITKGVEAGAGKLFAIMKERAKSKG